MAARGNAEWKGDLKGGSGTFQAGDSGIAGEFSFHTRFEDGPGANPEQLIGAALASCFSMAISNALSQQGNVPESVRTEAVVSIGKIDDATSITKIDLKTVGKVPGIDQATFEKFAEDTKTGCIVSRALAGVPEFTVKATLEG
ncbi:OsmC family peroxiredoxin [Miltoncostaea oceani]|uniref:OsmC family peroxiredoxin n=1 Tax=Miltoncostaea oceani TaxID=2843216 RepID=UPI001C3C8EA4|nr:OsmC family peroxiredoxin [Miltoncostaea oceani]